ncbi:MAG TPA: hypothetical protein VFP54_10970 [Acidimicrobiales bacterium]|nr:hypothetical protein [Acidimicrobiales bacterium]
MRFYFRTGRRTGVSVGWIGLMFMGVAYMLYISLLAVAVTAFLTVVLVGAVLAGGDKALSALRPGRPRLITWPAVTRALQRTARPAKAPLRRR